MRSRRLRAAWLQGTARSRRVLGAILIASGLVLWVTVAVSQMALGVVFSGVLVASGIILIAI